MRASCFVWLALPFVLACGSGKKKHYRVPDEPEQPATAPTRNAIWYGQGYEEGASLTTYERKPFESPSPVTWAPWSSGFPPGRPVSGGDFNGDGYADWWVVDDTTIWAVSGAGGKAVRFGTGLLIPLGVDVDGDGILDVLRTQPGQTLAFTGARTPPVSVNARAVPDVDGDAVFDLGWIADGKLIVSTIDGERVIGAPGLLGFAGAANEAPPGAAFFWLTYADRTEMVDGAGGRTIGTGPPLAGFLDFPVDIGGDGLNEAALWHAGHGLVAAVPPFFREVARTNVTFRAGSRFVLSGDHDGDGVRDVLVTEPCAGNAPARLVIVGGSDFSLLAEVPFAACEVAGADAGDRNGDGTADLLIGTRDGSAVYAVTRLR